MKRHAMFLAVLLCVSVPVTPQEHFKSCAEVPVHMDEVLGIRALPGAFVMDIAPGSPAEQAGLEVCDLIAGFDGQDFRGYGNAAAFVGAMREAAMFTGADLEVWRQSSLSKAYVQNRFNVRIPLQRGAKIGIDVTFQVLVLGVVKAGPADVAGVRPGEFIHQVNGQQVSQMRSVIELDQQISAAARDDGKVLLTLARWQPMKGSDAYKTTFTTREALIGLSSRDK